MPLETLSSIDLAALSKRDLKAICTSIMDVTKGTEGARKIDLRSNCEALRQFIEDYKSTLTPPLLAQLEEVATELEVTTPENTEVEEVKPVEAPVTSIPEETEKQNQFFTLVNAIGDVVANGCEMTVTTDNLTNLLQIKSIKDILTWSWERRTTQSAGALTALLYHNPYLLTSQGLGTLLYEASLVAVGEAPIQYRILSKTNMLKDLADIPRALEVPNVALFRQLTYTIRGLQLHLGISAIRPVELQGIKYLDYHTQLALLPEDKATLKAEAPKLTEQFLNTLKQPAYLERIDEEDNYYFTTPSEVRDYAQQSVYAWVYEESNQLTLCLAMQWDGNEAFDYQLFRVNTLG